MTQQPEALRLARELDDIHTTHVARNAAAELRRLHASCEDYAQHKQRQDQRVLELNAQRDALLAALKAIAENSDDVGAIDCARAALVAPVASEIHGCHGGEGSTLPERQGPSWAQRDALLEALKDATKTIEHLGYPLAAIERARAAIKAVEEGN